MVEVWWWTKRYPFGTWCRRISSLQREKIPSSLYNIINRWLVNPMLLCDYCIFFQENKSYGAAPFASILCRFTSRVSCLEEIFRMVCLQNVDFLYIPVFHLRGRSFKTIDLHICIVQSRLFWNVDELLVLQVHQLALFCTPPPHSRNKTLLPCIAN
jgi:hypothetical protein